MNSQELKNAYMEDYNLMAKSGKPENMKLFGKVMTEMFMWYADNKPEAAHEWLEKLSAVRWHQYLAPKEADMIVSKMEPKAPWTRDQWRQAMSQHDFPLEEEPYYNKCSLYVVMSMIYSDSFDTLSKYTNGDLFEVIYALALDKLKDADARFSVRTYFGL